MTTIVRPESFSCPSCSGAIFDEWYPNEYSFEGGVVPTREFWSDNAVTGPWNELRSLVACPICSAFFPYYSVKTIKEKAHPEQKRHLDEGTPFLQTVVSWHGSGDEDVENVVVLPDEYSWRIVAPRLARLDNFDFLFRALVAESLIQTFNDLVRNQVRTGTSIFGVAKEEELLDFLRAFSREAQDVGSESAWSDWAGCETWEFMGITRYNLMVAEVDRYLGNFDKAFERLTMIHNHIIETFHDEDGDADGVDYSKEFEDGPSLHNWDIEVALARVAIMLKATEEKESKLLLIHREPISESQFGRLIF